MKFCRSQKLTSTAFVAIGSRSRYAYLTIILVSLDPMPRTVANREKYSCRENNSRRLTIASRFPKRVCRRLTAPSTCVRERDSRRRRRRCRIEARKILGVTYSHLRRRSRPDSQTAASTHGQGSTNLQARPHTLQSRFRGPALNRA